MTTRPEGNDHSHEIDLEGALDFLNTFHLGHGRTDEQHEHDEHLVEPGDAGAWFMDHELIHSEAARQLTAADLSHVRDVRAALREIVDAVVEGRRPRTEAVALVNATLEKRHAARLELDGSSIRIGHRHAASPADDALAQIAMPIVEELGTGRPDRFRVCANDRCRWAFYDVSPTGRRRWCDMRSCGNAAKAARHRARVRASQTGATARTGVQAPA